MDSVKHSWLPVSAGRRDKGAGRLQAYREYADHPFSGRCEANQCDVELELGSTVK